MVKVFSICLALLAVTHPVWGQSCALPPNADQFSVVTLNDATVGAHNMYKGMAIGGTLADGSPNESATVDGTMSFINAFFSSAHKDMFVFNGGLQEGATTIPSSMWPQLLFLAENAKSSQSGSFKVVVKTSGGTFDLYDFRNGGQGEDNGQTLVIFNRYLGRHYS